MSRERRGEGLWRLGNNIGASETVEGRENAAEGGSGASGADCGREREKETDSHFVSPASPCSPSLRRICFAFFFITLDTFPSVRPASDSLFPRCPTSRLATLSVRPPFPNLWLPDSELLLLPSLLLSHSLLFPPFVLSLPSVSLRSSLVSFPSPHQPFYISIHLV